MKIVIDLSSVEALGAKGPDGVVWTFPDVQDRNTVQNVYFQKLAIGQMALLKATQENRPDLDDFILYVGEISIRLLQSLLTKDGADEPPSDEDAANLCAAGFVNRLMSFQAEGRDVEGVAQEQKTADQMIEEINLDEIKASFTRPTLVEAAPISTE